MRIFLLLFLVVIFSFIQTLDFSIFGIKPNLALAAIIVSVFFILNIWEGFLLSAMAALILKFSPGFSKEILIFFLIAVAAIIIKKYLPWQSTINMFFLIIATTLLFYAFSYPSLIISGIFLQELIYNIIITGLTFIIFHRICIK